MTMGASITSGQWKQIERICEDAGTAAIEAIGLNQDGAQRVITRGDELHSTIIDRIRELSVGMFADEEVRSNYTYSKEYKGPKPIEIQVELLLKYLPGFDPEPTFRYMRDVYPKLILPEWVEGAFVAPNEHVLEKFYPKTEGRTERYCAGIRLIHEKIAGSRRFYNYREGQIIPAHLRRIQKTAEMIDRLIESQGGADIIVHFAQLGIRHRGRSVRRAREVFVGDEFGLGSLEVGIIALTHPERFVRWEELHMDCAGDEFSSGAGGQFDRAPSLYFDGSRVGFSTSGVDDAFESYGSVSAFLPQ